MKHILKRSMAMLMALVMCISLLPAVRLTADATADAFSYVYSSDGKYIYNWGTRGETATSLSPNAETFYSNGNTYDILSAHPGGTGTSNAPSSALYGALQSLMAGKQTYQTSYDATRPLFQYTDCQNSGNPNTISSFYSGKAIGPAWDGGATWNREHTWPNSKGDASGNGENDIMMLRPASVSENSSRGNKAYGEGSNFYHPNSESDGKYDLRGDVARIMLYVYVRWGNTGSMWGSAGVMQSLDVLLAWMEADPVDTWELGRNDSVESITGTRNVFVDYPELAFLLFGADMPTDMTTPSGEAKNADTCQHNYVAGNTVAPTCTEEGYTVYTCSLCGKSYNGDKTPATGHNYVDGKCTVCQADEVLVPVVVTEVAAGTAYKLGLHSLAKDTTFYFNGTMSGYYGATDSNYDKGVDMYLEAASAGYYLYFMDASNVKQYINLTANGDHRNFTFAPTATSVFTWDAEKAALWTTIGSEKCYMGTYGDYVTMGVLKGAMLSDSDYIAQFYALGSSSDVEVCQHNYESVVTAPTCTKDGYTTYTCTLCGRSYVSNKTSATGHKYVDGVCTGCGEAAPEGNFATITFDDVAKRTELTTSKQVWVENGITVTNEKGSSTSNVADYSKPARFYKSSTVIIAYPGMTKIEVNCNTAEYATALKNSVTTGTASANGKVVTIVLPATADTYEVKLTGGQVRVDSITVYAEESGSGETPVCKHENTKVEGAFDATCTTDGHTGKTVCADCGATVDAGEVIPATGHNYVGGTCTGCGQTQPSAGEKTTVNVVIANYADANGWANGTKYLTIKMDDVVTVTASGKDNTGKYYTSGEQWRIYQTESPSIVISAGDQTIVSVKITYTVEKGGCLTYNGNKISSKTEVEVNASSVTFGVGNTGTATNGQVRITAIEVVYVGAAETPEPECKHENTKVEGAVAATCTTDGHTGKTVCTNCGATISEGKTIPALGHTKETIPGKAATCTETGLTDGVKCSVCDETLTAQEEIPALGHNYVDGSCTRCGEPDPNAPVVPEEPTVNKADFNTIVTSNPNGDGGYTNTYETEAGWVTVNAAIQTGGSAVINPQFPVIGPDNTYKAVCLNGKTTAPGKLTSPTLTGGISKLTMNYTKMFTDTKLSVTITITDLTTGAVYTQVVEREEAKDTKYVVWNYEWVLDTPITGDFTIEVVNNCPSGSTSNKDRFTILELAWLSASQGGSEPEQPVAPAAPTGDTIREDSIAFGMWCFVCQTDPCRYSSFGMNFVPEYITLGEVEQNAEGQWICEMTFRFAAFIEEVATVQLFPNHRIIFEGELPETTNYTLAWDDELQCWYYMGELVYYNFEPICQHTNTTVEGNIPATCTTDGHTGKTVCTDCGATISEGKTIPALGHTKETIPGKAATCTETGLTDGVKCSVCGEILTAQEEIPALGHNYVDGSCTRCDEPDPNAPEQPGETTTSTVTYIMSNYKVDGELGGGMFVRELDDVLTFTISTGWFSTEARIYKNANGVLASTKPISTLVINAGYKTSTFDVYTSEDGETWTLYQEDVAYVSAYSDVTITFDTPVKYIKLDSPNAQIRIKTLTVTYVEEGTTPEPECKHENTKVEGAVAATCTTDGYTGNTVCTDCGATISEGETIPALGHTKETIPGKAATCTETGLTDGVKCSVCGEILTAQEEIPALGHNYVDGSCTRCDEPDPNAPGETTEATVVLDFSTTDQRVSQDENAQVWASGPVTLTNVKHNSTQPIKDYSNPARFYASTKTTIACVGMTKIVFVCPTSAYANDLMASIGSAYGTFTTETEGNNTVVTLELTESVDSIEFVHTKQTRFRSMTVTYVAPSESPECKHENTKVEGAVAATCTTDGYTGNTVCADCGATISEGETISATGHTMAYAVAQAPKENAAGSLIGTCSVCGEQDEVNLPALNNLDYACQILTTPAGATGGTARYTWKNTTYGEFSFETAYVYGDSNGDGKVNLQDLLLLRQYIVNSDPISNVSTLAACAGIDADCDGKVTLLDVLMLRQYIAYSDPTTGESLVVLGPQ